MRLAMSNASQRGESLDMAEYGGIACTGAT